MSKKSDKDYLVSLIENHYTKKNIKAYYVAEKKKRTPLLKEWGLSFLWAACVVFLINQYFFQAFNIPSQSMEHTLKVSDRLFVDKLSYGPELLPGLGKLSFIKPDRQDIIIFENPDYRSKGTFFDIAHRMIFMLTLSIIDIDKEYDPYYGRKVPSKHFLIKRAVSANCDTIKFDNGDLKIKPYGCDKFYDESYINSTFFTKYNVIREKNRKDYVNEAKTLFNQLYTEKKFENKIYLTDYEPTKTLLKFNSMANPHNKNIAQTSCKYFLGWYIPEDCKMALGDNRDNSLDARWFGPIKNNKIIGRAGFIYFPFNRFGIVK